MATIMPLIKSVLCRILAGAAFFGGGETLLSLGS